MAAMPGAARPLLTTTIARVQETVESIRSIAMNLRPSMLDDLGAVSAVRWFCREFRDVYAQIRVHTDLSVTEARFPSISAHPSSASCRSRSATPRIMRMRATCSFHCDSSEAS